MQALMTIAAKDKDAASVVERLLPTSVAEDQELRTQQQTLNKIRKIRQKITKKEGLIDSKTQLMKAFIEDMAKHVAAEQKRHDQEIETLHREVAELKTELQQLKEGDREDPIPVETDDEEKVKPQDPEDLRNQLAAAKQEAAEAQQMAYAMKAQVDAYLHYHQLTAQQMDMSALIPPLTAVASPQKPKFPPGGNRLCKDVKAPFGVVRQSERERERSPRGSPYGRPGAAAEVNAAATQAAQMAKMD